MTTRKGVVSSKDKLPSTLFDKIPVPARTDPFTTKPADSLEELSELTIDEIDNLDPSTLTLIQEANIQLLLLAKDGNLNAIKALHDRLYGKPVEMTKIQQMLPPDDYEEDYTDEFLMDVLGNKKPV